MNKYRYTEVERFNARMPDGRLLIIERTQDLGLAPRLQIVISIYTIPLAFILALFGGPYIPVIKSAGFGPYILFLFAAVIIGGVAQYKLLEWMRNFDTKPDACEVIGMDCSTVELLDFFLETPPDHPTQRSTH